MQLFEGAFGMEFSPNGDELAVWDYGTLSVYSWPDGVTISQTEPILYTIAKEGELEAGGTLIADVQFDMNNNPILLNMPVNAAYGTTGRVELQQSDDNRLLLTLPPIGALSEPLRGACDVPLYFADPPGSPQVWQFEILPETQIIALKYNGLRYSGDYKKYNSIQFYQLDTGEQLYTLEEGIVDIAFLTDGQTWVAGLQDGRLQIRSIRDGSVLDEVDAYESPILNVAVSPNAQVIAVEYLDEVKMVNVADGTVTQRYPAVRAAFSPDGGTLALGYADGRIELRTATDGSLLKTLYGHTDAIKALTFLPSGEQLISAGIDCQLNVWQMPEGTLSGQLENYMVEGLLPGEDEATPVRVWDWTVPSDGQTIIGRFSSSFGVWDLPDGTLQRVSEPTNYMEDLAISPQGSNLAIAGSPMRIWLVSTEGDFSDGWEGHHGVTSVAFVPDGQMLVSGLDDRFVDENRNPDENRNGSIGLWLVENGELLHTLTPGTEKVTAVAFAPTGQYFVSVSLDGTVRLWGIP
ncbi:MAG TPA: hypothetical protein PLK31_23510 [Chloroflexota bacterium]|nr:hypothetical protein [Chloroflexota bacterium]